MTCEMRRKGLPLFIVVVCILSVAIPETIASSKKVAIELGYNRPEFFREGDGNVSFKVPVKIINRTEKSFRFTIVDSWRLLLVDDMGNLLDTKPTSRDATRAPTAEDSPLLKPGHSFRFTVYCRWLKSNNVSDLLVLDWTGASALVKNVRPSIFKISLIYCVQPESTMLPYASRQLGWDLHQLWRGLALSKWESLDLRFIEQK